MKASVVVIGAGIAGLSAAYRLGRLGAQAGVGLDITVIEREARPGGTIRTDRIDGFVVETGPDCFFAEKPYATMLVRELGMSERLIGTNDRNTGTYVLWDGRLHRLPEGVVLMIPTRFTPFVTSTLFSLPGKLRMGMELFVQRRTDGIDESLAEFTIRRFGREALERIAEPLVAGVHAGDPDTMSVKSSFPRFVAMEQKYGSLIRGMIAARRAPRLAGAGVPASMFMTMRDGLQEIVDELQRQSPGVSFRTGVSAIAVERRDGASVVKLSDGGHIEADGIVVAVPAYAAASILSPLSGELSDLLMSIPYVSTATVSLAYKKEGFGHPLKGFGFVVPRKENRHIMATTWTSSKFDNRTADDAVLLRCFVGGAAHQDLVSRSNDEIRDLVQRDLGAIMGVRSSPVMVRIKRWMKAMPQYTIGHEPRVRSIEQLTEGLGNICLAGSAYHGIGISDCINSGNTAAQSVLGKLLC